MKNILYKLLFLVLFATIYSCSEEHPTLYSYKQNSLGFEYDRNNYGAVDDSLSRFTFALGSKDIVVDTLWIEVRTMGFVVDSSRGFKLKQTEFINKKEGENLKQAKAGIHYVSFDDPNFTKYCQIPAGDNNVMVPIIILRDSSLKEDKYYLQIEIDSNYNFVPGYAPNRKRTIQMSDQLTKPKAWDWYVDYNFLGLWGPVKHQFVMDVLGKVVDDNYFKELVNYPSHDGLDYGYVQYIREYLDGELKKLNEQLGDEGPLRENPTEEGALGEIVNFYYNPWG